MEPDLPHAKKLGVGASEACILQLGQDVLLQHREGLTEAVAVAGTQSMLPSRHPDGVGVELTAAHVLEGHGTLCDGVHVP